MHSEKIQNRVCGSRFLLPCTGLLTALLWWLPQGGYSMGYGMGLMFCVLTALLLMGSNQTYALIRVRTRSVASVWLVMTASMGFLHDFQPGLLAAACLAASYYLLFRTYQEPQPVNDVFHAFLMLGLGTLFLPSMIWLVPFYFWYLQVFMTAFTFRGLWAGLIGFLLPLWMVGNGCLLTDRLSLVWDWWDRFTYFPLPTPVDYSTIPLSVSAAWLLVGGLAVWCCVQYLQHSYNDKIKTRMLLYVHVMQSGLILLLAVVQPHQAQGLLPLFLVSATPLLAHYFTLVRTWVCTAWFGVALLGCIALALLTLGGEWLPFPAELITYNQ